MVEGDGPLVGEEDLPFGELDGVFGGGGLCKEGLSERLGEGTAGHGDFEGIVALDAGRLALNDIGSQSRGESVDVGEREEVRLS